MAALIMAAQLILGLSILVTLHELGHYLAARAFGIRVEKFYLFFDAWGFKFFSFKKGDTEYGIGAIPLGGFVSISGMIDESLNTEQMKEEPKPYEFRAKPAWQRLRSRRRIRPARRSPGPLRRDPGQRGQRGVDQAGRRVQQGRLLAGPVQQAALHRRRQAAGAGRAARPRRMNSTRFARHGRAALRRHMAW